jgi:hypothetical protein
MSDKKKTRVTRPWDLLNPNMERVPEEVYNERLSICKRCPLLQPVTKVCASCGCVMPLKAKLADAVCPKHKWGEYTKENKQS